MNANVPFAVPEAVGLKVTPTVQFAPAVTVVPQVLDATANPALVTTPLMARLVLVRFVNVTYLVELVLATATVPKFNELVDSVTGAVPEPDRDTVCGLLPALSVNVKVPAADPVVVGENVTPTVQCAPAARLVPQELLAIANGATVVTDVIDNATDCTLVSVTVLVELVAPTTTEPKFKLLVDKVTGALPFPLRFTVCGLVPASSVNVNVPVAVPSVTGLNLTLTVQFVPAPIAPGQVLLAIANGPDTATPEMFRTTF